MIRSYHRFTQIFDLIREKRPRYGGYFMVEILNNIMESEYIIVEEKGKGKSK